MSSSIPEPSRGWAGVNGSSVGKVKRVGGLKGQEEVTVDFPECKGFVALVTELEVFREPKEGDKVQVKKIFLMVIIALIVEPRLVAEPSPS